MKLSPSAKRMVVERGAIQRRAKEIMSNPNLTEYQKRTHICNLASTNKYIPLKMLGEYVKTKFANLGVSMTPKLIAKNPMKAEKASMNTLTISERIVHKMVGKYIDEVGQLQKGTKCGELRKCVTRNLVFSPEGKKVLKNSIEELKTVNYTISPRSFESAVLGGYASNVIFDRPTKLIIACSKQKEAFLMRQKDLYKTIEQNATFNPLKMVVNGFGNLVDHFKNK